MSSTVTWRMNGSTDSTSTVKFNGERVAVKELLKQIREQGGIPSTHSIILRSAAGQELRENERVDAGQEVVAHKLSVEMARSVRDAADVARLFERPPRRIPEEVLAKQRAEKEAAEKARTEKAAALRQERPRERDGRDRGGARRDMGRDGRDRQGGSASTAIPSNLVCPVSRKLLVDGVILKCCGNTVAAAVVSQGGKCPVCREPDVSSIPDKRVRKLAKQHQTTVEEATA